MTTAIAINNESNVGVSFQAYQAAYHDLTGKTLKQSKSYEKILGLA